MTKCASGHPDKNQGTLRSDRSRRYRVPMIVASPWSRGGWVNSQVFDHTSTLMFLEDFVQKKYGKTVKEENSLSAWRRTVCGDLHLYVSGPFHDGKEPSTGFP